MKSDAESDSSNSLVNYSSKFIFSGRLCLWSWVAIKLYKLLPFWLFFSSAGFKLSVHAAFALNFLFCCFPAFISFSYSRGTCGVYAMYLLLLCLCFCLSVSVCVYMYNLNFCGCCCRQLAVLFFRWCCWLADRLTVRLGTEKLDLKLKLQTEAVTVTLPATAAELILWIYAACWLGLNTEWSTSWRCFILIFVLWPNSLAWASAKLVLRRLRNVAFVFINSG